MPLEPLVKNKGPLLITKIRGSVDDFPPEFVSKFGKDIYTQEVPVDVQPDELTGLLLESRVVQERTNERKKSNIYFGGGGPNGDSGLTLEELLADNCLVTEVLLPDGQVGTRNHCLVPEGTHVVATEFYVEATQRNLGNGWLDQIITTKPTVFANKTSAKEVPDLVPEIFKALLPTFTTEVTVAGTIVDPPVFSTGDFSKSENQIDVFTKRVSTRGRAGLTLPQTATILRHVGGEEYGGEITRLGGFLDDSEPVVDAGLIVVSSEVRNLGNGTWFKQTEYLDVATEWPELVGTEVDPRTGIVVSVKRKVVAAGTLGGVGVDGYVDIKPIDKWKSIRIASKLDPATLPALRQWETAVEYSFPNTLNGATWLWASASAPFAYDFDMALILDMIQGYAGPCRALVSEQFFNGPPPTVVATTNFFPQGHMVGFAWAYAADPSDECGTCIGIARATARTWSIPPALHGVISIGGGVVLTGGSITSVLPATTPAALPASGTLITKSVDVEPWRFNIFYRRMVQLYVP